MCWFIQHNLQVLSNQDSGRENKIIFACRGTWPSWVFARMENKHRGRRLEEKEPEIKTEERCRKKTKKDSRSEKWARERGIYKKREKKKGREKEKEQEGRSDAVRKRTRRISPRPRSMQSSPIEDALGNCTVIMPEWNRGRGVRGWEECRR